MTEIMKYPVLNFMRRMAIFSMHVIFLKAACKISVGRNEALWELITSSVVAGTSLMLLARPLSQYTAFSINNLHDSSSMY